MLVVSQAMCPVAPFFADWLYKNLSDGIRAKAIASNSDLRHESVHLSFLPAANESVIDLDLEQRMDYAQRISSLVLSLRRKEKMRVRQPLQKILLPVLDSSFERQVDAVKDLILSEVNIKEIEYLTDSSGVIKKRIKSNFKTLGRRLGKNMKAGAAIINGLTQEDIATIEKTNAYSLNLDGEIIELTKEDFEITSEDIPGWLVASDADLTVALDVTLTDELRAEGMARELVNRIQGIRRNQDFNVTDKIAVVLQKHEAIAPAVEQFGDYICNETLAVKLKLAEEVEGEEIELTDDLKLNIVVALNK